MWGSRVQSILLAFIPQTDYGNEDKFRWIRVNFSGPALCKHGARCSLGYGGRQLGVTLNNYNNLQRGSCPIDPLVATQLHLFSRQRRTFNACRVLKPMLMILDTKSLTWRCHKLSFLRGPALVLGWCWWFWRRLQEEQWQCIMLEAWLVADNNCALCPSSGVLTQILIIILCILCYCAGEQCQK